MALQGGEAVLPILHAVIKSASFGFDLKAVPAQAKDLLDTIDQVRSDVSWAKNLRRRTSSLLYRTEKRRIDNAIENTEKALGGLAELVERPRVDIMVSKNGKVGARSRLLWVLKDAGSVPVTLARLNTANMSLQTQIILMAPLGRTQCGNIASEVRDFGEEGTPPPPYETTKENALLRRQSTRIRKGLDIWDDPMLEDDDDEPDCDIPRAVDNQVSSNGAMTGLRDVRASPENTRGAHRRDRPTPESESYGPPRPRTRLTKVRMDKSTILNCTSDTNSAPSVSEHVRLRNTSAPAPRPRKHHDMSRTHEPGHRFIASALAGAYQSPGTPHMKRSQRWLDNKSPIPRNCVKEV